MSPWCRNVGARLLARAIGDRGCPRLEYLNLSATDLGDAGAKEIGRCNADERQVTVVIIIELWL